MDDCRFENWSGWWPARVTGGPLSWGLPEAPPAPLTLARAELGIAQESGVALEADCRVNGGTCGKDNDCCSGSCGTDGFCD